MEEAPVIKTSRLKRVRKNLGHAMSLAWAASPRALIRFSLLGMFNAIMPPISVYLGSELVNKIAAAQTREMKFSEVLYIVIGLWFTFVVQRAVGAYMGFGRNLYVRRVELEAERRLLEKASRVDVGHFDHSDWHDRLARAKRDVNWRPGDLTWSILGLSGNIVTIILMAGLLASLHYILVILALGASILTLVLESRVTAKLYKYYYKETPEERERQYLGDLLVQPRNIKEVRAYTIADYLLGRHKKLTDDLFKQRVKMSRLGSNMSFVSGIITGTILALAYVFVALKGISGTINPGAVVLVIGAFTSVSGTLQQITGTFVAVDQHTTFLDDYFSFLQVAPLIPVPEKPITIPAGPIDSISFEKIVFHYPGQTDKSINGLNLEIKKGELIALVGENGAGKSTLVKLLLRFYDVNEGSIKVDGIDVKDMNPEELRSRIGVLFQDYATYELSVRENVIIGRPNGQATTSDNQGQGPITARPVEADDEKVIEALKDARSEWLLKKMPNGLDSKVGRLFEGGHDLSGGEWQRLALARIMYRDADIWILDEPTSSLDPEAEAGIFAELKENLKGRIGIVISHRFSTVRIADRIAVIDDGKVIELGSHQELLAAGNRYARLFELQASGYR